MNINYFLYHLEHPVDANMPEWRAAIPVRRPGAIPTGLLSISYGSYFTAVRDFLTVDDGLSYGLSQQQGHTIALETVDRIDIIIQKHGAFYHPARVNVWMGNEQASFVVNVAISAEGRAGLRSEFDLLYRLNSVFPQRYIPAVYSQAVIECEEKPHRLPMFLGEWLSGFHEFHVHLNDTPHPTLSIWNPNRRVILDTTQKKILFRQVAKILTYYYDLQTFEQVFPWHHGAGDFVVQVHDSRPIVRLITVRGYSSLVDAKGCDPATIIDALLRFFVHLSLRTRIDRVDGTGDLIWVDDSAVEGTLLGFLEGLAVKGRISEMPDSVKDIMGYYLLQLSTTDLIIRIEDTLNAYPSQSPERHLMALHQYDHAKALFKSIAELSPSGCH